MGGSTGGAAGAPEGPTNRSAAGLVDVLARETAVTLMEVPSKSAGDSDIRSMLIVGTEVRDLPS